MTEGLASRSRSCWVSILSVLTLFLSACGGGGGGGQSQNTTSGPDISVNQLVDGPTAGLGYVSGQQSGITDGLGLYLYELEQTITFSVGDIVLGAADPAGKSLLTPVDMVAGAVDETDPAVTNILRFLQTIDDDGNHDNGIEVTAAVRAQAANASIDFNQSVSAFEQDVNVQSVVADLTMVTSAGTRSLVPTAAALANFRQSMLFRRIGNNCADYAGSDTGTLDFAIDQLGVISGSGQSNTLGAFTLTGQVDSSGNVSMISTASGVQIATFSGAIDINRNFNGSWTDGNGSTGTVSGARSGIPCTQLRGGDGGLGGAVRIGYDIYNGLFRYQMAEIGAPVDVLQPYTRTVILRGSEKRAEEDGTAWLPIDFNIPPTLGRVPFDNRWIHNGAGLYQYDGQATTFKLQPPENSTPTDIFFSFLTVDVPTLGSTISIGSGTVTGVEVGAMKFRGHSCTLYDLTTSEGQPAGQVCLARFSGVNDAVALYYHTIINYTDTGGTTSPFDLKYVAREVALGIALDSDTFTAP